MRKIRILFFALFGNFSFFLYLLFHYFNKKMPRWIARKIAKKNFRKYDSRELCLKSYDCSNQFVHPDMCFYRGKYYLIITPYPYGMDEYENPSLFVSDSLGEFNSYGNNPLAIPKYSIKGNHLSDPEISILDDKLYIFYRESIPCNKHERNIIYYKEIGDKDFSILADSSEEDYLSPAIWESNSIIYMMYSNKVNLKNEVYLNTYDSSFNYIEKKNVKILNLPLNYYVWHLGIDISKSDKNINNCMPKGIFLLRNYIDNDFVVGFFESTFDFNEWKFIKELEIPKDILINLKHPYKCSFIPNSDKIVLSFRDLKDRYRVYII